jgi:predicted porin
MKVRVFAALMLGCIDAAFAQGQLTVYGSLDESIPWISNIQGHSAMRVDAAISQPDLFGIRGAEDLGGGTRALFKLENGFLTNTGSMIAAGKIFNRASWLGLEGTFGTIKLGRQVDFTAEQLGQWGNGYQLFNFYLYHPGNLDGLSSQFPVDNAISYNTPIYAGLRASAMYGFGDASGNSDTKRTVSLAGTYEGPRLKLAIAYTDAKGRAFDIAGTTGISRAFGQDLVAGRSIPIDSFKVAGFGGGYQLEDLPISVNALYSHSALRVGASEGIMNAADLGVTWQASATTSVTLGYSLSKFEKAKWHQLHLGTMYAFSKRTQLYAFWTYQHAVDGVASMNVVGVSSGRNQAVLSVGIHTSF